MGHAAQQGNANGSRRGEDGLAREHARQVLPLIRLYRTQGYGWRMVARLLNLGGIQAPRGGGWHPNAGEAGHASG